MNKLLLISLVFLSGCFGFHYSEGSRAGTVVKFSQKGFVFKTWEGEMMINAMTQTTGGIMTPEIFTFSVKDNGPIEEIKKALKSGEHVELNYSQDLYFWGTNGDTNHFIISVSKKE